MLSASGFAVTAHLDAIGGSRRSFVRDRAMLEDSALALHFDVYPQGFAALRQRANEAIEAAFERGQDDAMAGVHATLFALYELHVAPAASKRCVNQFNPYLTLRVFTTLEQAGPMATV